MPHRSQSDTPALTRATHDARLIARLLAYVNEHRIPPSAHAFAMLYGIQQGEQQRLARGNENNAHEPDGTYYLGPGFVPGYTTVNLGARYSVTTWMQLVGQVTNVFDRRYYTAGQLGPAGFTDTGSFIARPLPAINGEFPVRQGTFYAPGAPVRMWVGTRFKF